MGGFEEVPCPRDRTSSLSGAYRAWACDRARLQNIAGCMQPLSIGTKFQANNAFHLCQFVSSCVVQVCFRHAECYEAFAFAFAFTEKKGGVGLAGGIVNNRRPLVAEVSFGVVSICDTAVCRFNTCAQASLSRVRCVDVVSLVRAQHDCITRKTCLFATWSLLSLSISMHLRSLSCIPPLVAASSILHPPSVLFSHME